MAGVRDELPYPRLALLARMQRVVNMVKHPVQRGPNPTDLGMWIAL